MIRQEPVSKVMSADVVTVSPQDEFSKVRRLMRDLLLHHVPVVEQNRLIGIISRVDVLKAWFSSQLAGSEHAPEDSLDAVVDLRSIMSADPVTIKESATVYDAAQLLRAQEFNALPVVNELQELVGIVTSKDLIEYLFALYPD